MSIPVLANDNVSLLMAGGRQSTTEELRAFLAPDDSAYRLISRSVVERHLTNVPFIDEHVQLRPGYPLEIAGPSSSGKTEILIQVGKAIPQEIHLLMSD